MVEFLESYGLWIFLGLFFSLMLWRGIRGHGVGCCGGGHQHVHEKVIGEKREENSKSSSGCH